jgi:hypothetical protein
MPMCAYYVWSDNEETLHMNQICKSSTTAVLRPIRHASAVVL